ncbi:hypothetical protein K432DRAFT_388451 [Lepidopterella palustris CBS 459.81]|uniref:Uncharacterized protein n=1 Tax=Lepidopterella palustris CBS 459.81 TaxID=1314670 RepID=A0A8E2EKI8_9PEZI|nr:hypothetical protein K432DRAFT_388451 [Lepidopterella palustris CBS 459.81]
MASTITHSAHNFALFVPQEGITIYNLAYFFRFAIEAPEDTKLAVKRITFRKPFEFWPPQLAVFSADVILVDCFPNLDEVIFAGFPPPDNVYAAQSYAEFTEQVQDCIIHGLRAISHLINLRNGLASFRFSANWGNRYVDHIANNAKETGEPPAMTEEQVLASAEELDARFDVKIDELIVEMDP